jgi:hypothetical protein
MSVADLHAAATAPTYKRFEDKPASGKASRQIQEPSGLSLTLHYNFLRLLDRVQRPDFLHSATKKRSNVSNADAHKGLLPSASTDISRFYENTTRAHVKEFLHKDLGLAHDLARLLADALTADGHLPTGSAVSPLLSYFTHQRRFAEIEEMCLDAGVKLTLFIDDLTISGSKASKALLYRIKGVMQRAGLKTHKDRVTGAGHPMVVTGAVPIATTLRLRNRHRLGIMSLLDQLKAGDLTTIRTLAGKIASAKIVDPNGAARLERIYQQRVSELRAAGHLEPEVVGAFSLESAEPQKRGNPRQ